MSMLLRLGFVPQLILSSLLILRAISLPTGRWLHSQLLRQLCLSPSLVQRRLHRWVPASSIQMMSCLLLACQVNPVKCQFNKFFHSFSLSFPYIFFFRFNQQNRFFLCFHLFSIVLDFSFIQSFICKMAHFRSTPSRLI